MSIVYNGAHSITFTDTCPSSIYSKNTWTDFYLVPQGKQYIVPSTPSISVTQIPGASSMMDFSESIANKLLYSRRTGSWNFILDIERIRSLNMNTVDVVESIRSFFNGRSVYCELDDDSRNRSYHGRVYLKEIKKTETYPELEIDYDFDYEVLEWSISRQLKVIYFNNDSRFYDGAAIQREIAVSSLNLDGISTVYELSHHYIQAIILHEGNQFPDLRFKCYASIHVFEPLVKYEYIKNSDDGVLNIFYNSDFYNSSSSKIVLQPKCAYDNDNRQAKISFCVLPFDRPI